VLKAQRNYARAVMSNGTTMKLCLGTESGKTKHIEVQENKALFGKKIGDTIKGEVIDMPGYEFLLTGGSDSSGFPMRKDVESSGKKKLLIVSGTGLKKNTRKGRRVRKTVAGNTVGAATAQINLKVTKTGQTPLFEEPKAEEPAGASEE